MLLPTKLCFVLFSFGAVFWLLSIPIALLYLALLAGACLLESWCFPSVSKLDVALNPPPHFVQGRVQTIEIAIRNDSKRWKAEFEAYFPEPFQPALIFETFDLPAHGELTMSIKMAAHERGLFSLKDGCMKLSGILLQKQFPFPFRQELKVYPDYRLENDIAALNIGNPSSEEKRISAYGANEGEFDSLRPYVPGEEIRNIDWKVTARRGEWISRNWTEELQTHLLLLIDCGRRMADSLGKYQRLDCALQAAIQLCHAAIAQMDSVSLIAFSDRIDARMPETYKQEILPLALETVYQLKPRTVESDYWQVFGQALLQTKKRSLMILFSDLLDIHDSAGMLSNLSKASQDHLVICAVLKNNQLIETAQSTPVSEADWYLKGAACHLALQRQIVLEKMKNTGIHILEADAPSLSLKIVETYLNLRVRGS
ncbi:MAG: DUF58 domain-containing protein [Parachlamydia sp.]|nr:DUF58 domain-containing protein [Parachlamydia sp.]